MRKSRPDGNCFFRAFGFSLFNSLLNDQIEIDRLIAVGHMVLQDLHAQGFSFTVDDFHDAYQECLAELKDGKVKTSQQLLDLIFNDNSRSDYLVVFLRLITSSHLQKNAEFFQAFIEDGMSVKEFCAHEVEPMYKESDHIHVIAITTATGVAVRINYLDRGGSADKINVHDFPEGVDDPAIHLLYRPGHYDVLYPTNRTVNSSSNNNNNAADSFVTSSSPPAENADETNGCNSSSSSNNITSNNQENGAPGRSEETRKEIRKTVSTDVVSAGTHRSHAHVSSSSPTSSSSHHVNQNSSSNSCEGVSSSKNPRLDPGVSSSGENNEDEDSNEPSTTS